MRHAYVVTYDICDPRRLRRVFQLMRGYGDPLQLSVFQCDLNRTERVQLETELTAIIHAREDQVLFIKVARAGGHGGRAISALGRSYLAPEPTALVI